MRSRLFAALALAAVFVTGCPAVVPSCSCTEQPGEFCGSHTTCAGMGVSATGRVMAPRGPVTVTLSPSASPRRAANSGLRRATGRAAVPQPGRTGGGR